MVLLSVAALGFAMLPGAITAANGQPSAAAVHGKNKAKTTGEELTNYDSRTAGANRKLLQTRKAMLEADASPALRATSESSACRASSTLTR